MNDNFYVSFEGRTIGPMTGRQVVEAIQSRSVPGDANVCAVGATEWSPITEVEPLASALRGESAYTAPLPPPPPPPIADKAPPRPISLGQRALNACGAFVYATMAFGVAWVTFAEFVGVGLARPGTIAAHEWAWRPSVPCAVIAFAVGYWFETKRSLAKKLRHS